MWRKINALVIFITLSLLSLNPFQSQAQTSPTPICEQLSKESVDSILALKYYQVKEVRQVLRKWEAVCGKTEPILRIQILLDIREGKLLDTTITEYLAFGYFSFVNRVQNESYENWATIYSGNKAFYGYVPFRTDFDSWSIESAGTNIRYTNPGTAANDLCNFFMGNLEALDNLRKVYHKKYEFDENPAFSIKVGSWIPLGKTAQSLRQSINLGVGLSGAITKKYRIGFNFDYTLLAKHPDFLVNVGGKEQLTNADGIISVGMDFIRRWQPNENYKFDLSAGLAYSRIDTDILRRTAQEDTAYYGIRSLAIPIRIGFLKRIKDGPLMGLGISYNFAPYAWDKRLVSPFSPSSITISAVIAFDDND